MASFGDIRKLIGDGERLWEEEKEEEESDDHPDALVEHRPVADKDSDEDEDYVPEAELLITDDKPRCECQFCHNMVLIEDLDSHELQCEQQLSNKHIESILNQYQPNEDQQHLENFEDEFPEYIRESTNDSASVREQAIAQVRQRLNAFEDEE